MSQYMHQDAKLWQRVKIGRSTYTAIGRDPKGVMLWKGASGPTIYVLLEKAAGEWGTGRFDDRAFAHPIAQQFSHLSTEIKRYIRAQQKSGSVITPGGIRKNIFTFNNPKLKFKDLSIGETFVFSSEDDPRFLTSGIARGPWIKRGAREYEHVDDVGKPIAQKRYGAFRILVGSVNAEVVRSPRANGVRRNIFTFNNPPSGPADESAARELELYIDNDADLHRQQFVPIVKNLMLKRRKGIYDREKAVKLFMYLMESGAKKYVREFVQSSTPGSIPPKIDTVFNKNTRLLAARRFRDSFETEAELGNYDRMIGPVSNPGYRESKPEFKHLDPVYFCRSCGHRRSEHRHEHYDPGVKHDVSEEGPCKVRGCDCRRESYFNNPRGVRKNIFTFNNPKRPLNEIEQAAVTAGLSVATWAPGDGVTRYRFFKSTGSPYADYHQGNALYTANGRKDAMAFIRAYGMGRGAKLNPRAIFFNGGSNPCIGQIVCTVSSHPHGPVENAAYGQRRSYADFIARKKAEYGSKFDASDLAPQFISYYESGQRIEVEFISSTTGKPYETKRGRVGVTTGWKPVFLLMLTTRSIGSSYTLGKNDRVVHVVRDNPGEIRQNPLLQTVFAANPPISAQWDRMTGRQRLAALGFVGFPDDYAATMTRAPWSRLSATARRALERGWAENPLTRGEAGRLLREAKSEVEIAAGLGRGHPRSQFSAAAITKTGVVQRFGPRSAHRTARRLQDRAARVGTEFPSNPLTRREAASVLRRARYDLQLGSSFRPGHTRSERGGQAHARAQVVRQHGPRSAGRVAMRIADKAQRMVGTTISNPGTLRLPRPGTRMTVSAALELAQRIGDLGLIEQCRKALKLQKAANKNSKCVIWKTFAMGSKNKIDSVVALTHYGDSPETMYKPPKGSRKGQHMYRHKWGEGGGGKKSVPLLASADGKMLLMPLEGRKVAADWLRH